MNYFDIVLLKYPGIQRVMYWQAQQDGTPWNDPYDGLLWENTDIPKPTKEELDQWGVELQQQYTFQQNATANQPILAQLDELDKQSIRALREPSNYSTNKLNTIAQEAAALRAQLLPTSDKS